MTDELPTRDDVSTWMAETPSTPPAPQGDRISVHLPASTTARLAELARTRGRTIEEMAAELLIAAVAQPNE